MEVRLAPGAFFWCHAVYKFTFFEHIGSKWLICIFNNIYFGQLLGGGPNSKGKMLKDLLIFYPLHFL